MSNGVADLTGEVVALLDHLRVGKTHVLGTSLGGFVAQELALARPDLVDRLVLVCTSYGGRGPEAMSPGALADMMGLGTFSAEAAARKALEAATGEVSTGPRSLRSSSRSCAGGWQTRPRPSPTTSRQRPAPGSISWGMSGTYPRRRS